MTSDQSLMIRHWSFVILVVTANAYRLTSDN